MNKKLIYYICLTLVIIGGINLGLIGLFNFNLLASIFGVITRLLYIVIGLAAGYLAYISVKS